MVRAAMAVTVEDCRGNGRSCCDGRGILATDNRIVSLVNYYNEYEPFAVEWLRELIKDGLIPAGDVDSRSIAEVEPSDLSGYKQCHFFAGIGGWAYAARLAGWRDDRPMWTGSPPCQPFSQAGKQQGTNDERHLWPVWFNLVRQCRPPIIFGEQVSAAIRHGWLDALQEDLEAEDYACGAIVLPASSVGAVHKRDRLWFVAHSNNAEQCTDSGTIQRDNRNDSGWCGAGIKPILCRDNKIRYISTEPALFPLANGIPNRVGILRGAGNAIVPQVAAEIIKQFV